MHRNAVFSDEWTPLLTPHYGFVYRRGTLLHWQQIAIHFHLLRWRRKKLSKKINNNTYQCKCYVLVRPKTDHTVGYNEKIHGTQLIDFAQKKAPKYPTQT